MFEKIFDLAINDGGIWCVLCVYMIYVQGKKLTALEDWCKGELIPVLQANTALLKEVKEQLHADKRDR
jgi:hypothetical protein